MNSKKIEGYYLVVFYILLLLSTYLGFGEEYIISTFILIVAIKSKFKIKIDNKNKFFVFVFYYGVITTIGVLVGNVTIKNYIQYFIRYFCGPYVVWILIPENLKIRVVSIIKMRNIILYSALYGTLEFLIHYNVLCKLVRIDAKNWIVNMNTASTYQPSSIYLHYNFYACILLIGWVLVLFYPYRTKSFNFLAKCLLVSQLFFTQSRVCWIAFMLVTLCYLIKVGILTYNRARSMIILVILGLIFTLIKYEIIQKFFYAIQMRFDPIFKYRLEYGSVGQRIGTLLNWPKYALKNPIAGVFGTGFSSIGFFLQKYSYFPGYTTADNQWTTFLVEIGVFGSTMLIILIVWFMRKNKNGPFHCMSVLLIGTFLIETMTFDLMGTSFISIVVVWSFMIDLKSISSDTQ